MGTFETQQTREAGAFQVQDPGPSWRGFDPQAPSLGPNRNTDGPSGAQNGRNSRTLGPFRRIFFLPLITQN
jgi:hypothetical protein